MNYTNILILMFMTINVILGDDNDFHFILNGNDYHFSIVNDVYNNNNKKIRNTSYLAKKYQKFTINSNYNSISIKSNGDYNEKFCYNIKEKKWKIYNGFIDIDCKIKCQYFCFRNTSSGWYSSKIEYSNPKLSQIMPSVDLVIYTITSVKVPDSYRNKNYSFTEDDKNDFLKYVYMDDMKNLTIYLWSYEYESNNVTIGFSYEISKERKDYFVNNIEYKLKVNKDRPNNIMRTYLGGLFTHFNYKFIENNKKYISIMCLGVELSILLLSFLVLFLFALPYFPCISKNSTNPKILEEKLTGII